MSQNIEYFDGYHEGHGTYPLPSGYTWWRAQPANAVESAQARKVQRINERRAQGADEINALVLDPGYSVVRAGFAGEDVPKSVVPSHYGVSSKSNYVFDDNSIHNPYANLDIRNPMSEEGLVEDWDVAAKLWEYAITSRLTVPPTKEEKPDAKNGDMDVDEVENNEKPMAENPLLMAEPSHNVQKNREKAIEVAMEDWGVPAFYLAKSGVLAAFASGRPSALVVDVGASTASVTAMHEGMILKKATTKSSLAGNWVSNQIQLMLGQISPTVTLRPHYQIAAKSAVDAGAAPSFTLRKFEHDINPSFHRLQEERLLSEFKESCVQAWNPMVNHEAPLSSSADFIRSQSNPAVTDRPFEFPDGSNSIYGKERFDVAEGLFNPKAAFTSTEDSSTPPPNESIQALCVSALSNVDVDLRQGLLNSVVSTGGTSMIQGFNDRLHWELSNAYPGTRVRIHSPSNVYERRFGPWIGGSILASLGSFHQLWISKKEYEEVGPNIVEKRCK